MRRATPQVAGLVLVLGLAACEADPASGDAAALDGSPDLALADAPLPPDSAPVAPDLAPDLGPDAGTSGGELYVLTYNVAGLPFGVSKSDPDKNTPLISPLLNPFDVVLIQEDFAYTAQLSSKATHPYKSVPGQPLGTILNDGLTLFSRLPFANLVRHKWVQCFGFLDHSNDCLAAKGFFVAELELAPGLTLDLYDLHMDAGGADGDYDARAAQVDQLLNEIATRSAGRAVIVAGDTNFSLSASVDNQGLLDKLLLQGALTDACQALSCGDPRIDRVMYRSAAGLGLTALSWAVDPSFVDGEGAPLSDHEAVAVRLRWDVTAPADAGPAEAGPPEAGTTDLAAD